MSFSRIVKRSLPLQALFTLMRLVGPTQANSDVTIDVVAGPDTITDMKLDAYVLDGLTYQANCDLHADSKNVIAYANILNALPATASAPQFADFNGKVAELNEFIINDSNSNKTENFLQLFNNKMTNVGVGLGVNSIFRLANPDHQATVKANCTLTPQIEPVQYYASKKA